VRRATFRVCHGSILAGVVNEDICPVWPRWRGVAQVE
jgi:hypothetical protein